MALLDHIKGLLSPLMDRFDNGSINDRESLALFLHTRSAYVAQTALFGYLKTRMGTRYREIFQDPDFEGPLKNAQRQAFLHCLSDLVVYAVARIAMDGNRSYGTTDLAITLFDDAAKAALPTSDMDKIHAALEIFRRRIDHVDWQAAARDDAAFTESPDGVIDAAPVIDGYREADRLIVVNSVRFRWAEIRRQFNKRCDPAAFHKTEAMRTERSFRNPRSHRNRLVDKQS